MHTYMGLWGRKIKGQTVTGMCEWSGGAKAVTEANSRGTNGQESKELGQTLQRIDTGSNGQRGRGGGGRTV